VSWGVTTYVLAIGPLSEQRVTRFVPIPAVPARPASVDASVEPRAA